MDDDAFLARVAELLPQHLYPYVPDVVVTSVRPAGGRPWPRAEVTFELTDPPASWTGPTSGSAYLPLAEDWRWASGYEEPDDYAMTLASEVEHAARRVFDSRPTPPEPTPAQVGEAWPWLLERLALYGPVSETSDGRLVVEDDEYNPTVTVIVTPEQWARIGTPPDHEADDPQDFGMRLPGENYLVFYEDGLAWSIRPELPPVRWGAETRRQVRAAQARGENVGWFAYRPADEPG